MIILGIDPGFSRTGYGILQQEKSKAFLLDYGYLKLSPKQPLSTRVRTFHDFFSQKSKTYAVTDIALETPFLGKNAQNFLKLGYLRGILYLLADTYNTQLHEFAPRQVKQAVTGWGNASKEQVASIISQLFPALKTQKYHDVTDALAITLSALWISTNPISKSKQSF
jgi:crossover junction endodeoxyribonuclease RuvC